MYQKQQGINNRSTVKNIGERAVPAAPLRISGMSSAGKTGIERLVQRYAAGLVLHHLAYKINDNRGGSTGGVPSRWMLEMTERSDSSVAAVGRYTP